MEQIFGKNSIDIKVLREFCEREGKEVTFRKGDQLERENRPRDSLNSLSFGQSSAFLLALPIHQYCNFNARQIF